MTVDSLIGIRTIYDSPSVWRVSFHRDDKGKNGVEAAAETDRQRRENRWNEVERKSSFGWPGYLSACGTCCLLHRRRINVAGLRDKHLSIFRRAVLPLRYYFAVKSASQITMHTRSIYMVYMVHCGKITLFFRKITTTEIESTKIKKRILRYLQFKFYDNANYI